MTPIYPPTLRGTIRASDEYGSGAFAASRDGGRRKHAGVDLLADPMDPIYSPCDGIVTRLGKAYADPKKSEYMLIEVANGPFLIRVMYVLPDVKAGDRVAAHQLIGHAQNISKAYSPQMGNHVHMDIRVAPRDTIVDGEHSARDVYINPMNIVVW